MKACEVILVCFKETRYGCHKIASDRISSFPKLTDTKKIAQTQAMFSFFCLKIAWKFTKW